jgi:hypothetical protein
MNKTTQALIVVAGLAALSTLAALQLHTAIARWDVNPNLRPRGPQVIGLTSAE